MEGRPHDDEPRAGRAFGDYDVVELLGHGGMGQVFKARHRTLERDVALKVLFPRLSHDEFFVSRFLKEARAAARLNHPNIVQIYDFGKVGTQYYLAMEFVDGRSLGRLLKNWGPFPEAQAVALMRQACVALSVAHAAGIVHRDIKPENFMLTKKGQLKLVDLGLAKRVDDEPGQSLTGFSAGTPHYISPEQIEGLHDVDGRADIYSLGATVFHLVTGQVPFSGGSSPVIMSRHLNERRPDPRSLVPALSPALSAVILRMMARDRKERYPDVFALDADLYRLQAGIEEEAGSETQVAPAGKPEPPTKTEEIPELKAALSAPRAQAVPRPLGAGPPAAPAAPLSPGSPSQPSAPPSVSVVVPDSSPSALAAWDAGLLARMEELLAPAVGPLAKVLVKRCARLSTDAGELIDLLAAQISDGPARSRFVQGARAAAGAVLAAPTPSGSLLTAAGRSYVATETPAGPGSASGPGAFSDADLARVEAALAPAIGPLAKVLVRKAAKGARSFDELTELLGRNLATDEERRRFREALRKGA